MVEDGPLSRESAIKGGASAFSIFGTYYIPVRAGCEKYQPNFGDQTRREESFALSTMSPA